MAICEIHLSSGNVLNKMTSLMVIMPEGRPGPFPVCYLLHGLSDDHTAWTRRTSIERYVEGLPLIVVMPNGERSFYTDARENPKAAFETFLTRDLIRFVDNTFQTIPSREGRVIAGLSMGGYGAVKFAFKHPDTYCAAVSHSGALHFGHFSFSETEDDWVREFAPILGGDPQGGPDDIYALAERADRGRLPALRIDCGAEDFLIEQNRDMHRHLEALSIPHEYAEHPGGHDWGYWDMHIQDTLRFFGNYLGFEFRPADHISLPGKRGNA